MQMKSVIKRLLSAFLCAVMVLGCLTGVTVPVKAETATEAAAYAGETVTADSTEPETAEETEPAVVSETESAAAVQQSAVESAVSLAEDTYTTADGKWSFAPYGEGVEITAYHGTATDVYVPFKVTYNEENYAVLKLADSLFADNDSLNSVTLGEGILEIGAKTFYDCDNLVCIVTNETLTTIGAEAFYSCDSFNSVILYDAVSTIGENAFAECPSLTIWCNESTAAYTYATENAIPYEILNPDATPETYIQDGITYYIMNGEAIAISYDMSSTEVIVATYVEGYPVTELRGTFQNCSNLTSVTLPNTIQNIGSKTFYCCKKLQTVNIPAGVQQIGFSAFEDCSVLTAIDLPDGLQTIEYACFADCDGLTEIEIPETVTTIADEAFYSCNKLQSVVIPDSVTSIGGWAFYNSSLKTLTVGSGVKKMGTLVFASCYGLKEVIICDGAEVIGSNAFRDCYSLTNVVIPDTVKTIEYNAFGMSSSTYCNEIKTLDIGNGVQTIGANAFSACTQVQTIVVPESLQQMSTNSFPASAILCVYENSYAHTVAVNNDLMYFVYDGTNLPQVYIIDGISYYIKDGSAIAYTFDQSLTSVVIPDQVESYPVTELRGTFQNCSNLTSVTLPNTIQNIGSKTFYCCEKLQTVNIPAGVQQIGSSAFEDCSVLTAIDLPDGLQTIEYACFADCDGLTEIKIPETVTTIADEAFYSCNKLQSVVIPDSVTSIGKWAFENSALKTLTIGGGVKEMGVYAFASCYGLKEVIICDGAEVIGSCAFLDCYSLTNVVIPDTVKTIGANAFGMSSSTYCNKIKTLDIGNGVQTIGANAFSACTQVQTIVVPESLQQMSTNSFPRSAILCVYENSYAHTFAVNYDLMHFIYDGTNLPQVYIVDGISYYIKDGSAIAYTFDQSLTSVVIPDQVESYPVTELRGTFQNCSSLTSVTLPNTIRNIGSKTFYCCRKLQTVNIPAGVQQIGSSAFEDCSVLTAIDLPDGLQTIEYACFADCDGLTEIKIPETVTTIADEAFYSCNKLQSVVIPDSVTSIGGWAFYTSSLKTLTIGGGVKEMGTLVFASCYGLKEVIICDGTEVIGNNAFLDCYRLTNVVIPDTVKTIEYNAFGMSSSTYCNEIKTLDIGNGVQTIGANAFSACTQVQTIVVPESLQQMSTNSFPASAILCVYENSYAHTFAVNNDLMYFVMRKTENPEISFGAGISGNVTYLDGTAAANATVEIFYDDGVLKESVVTDENGTYEFTYAEVGAYTIRVTDASGNTASTAVSVKRMNAFNVFLSGDPDLKLKKGYSVSGAVNTYPATVTITDENGNVLDSTESTDGSFSFSNIPNGTYIITATTENGSVSQEITVFDGNVSEIVLTVTATAATLWGYVEVEDRELGHHRRNWVEVTVYNADGIAVAQSKTDKDGKYTFTGLPAGEYSIVAQTAEMRPDRKHGFDRSHALTGYAYIDITEAGTYQVETIILREENDCQATISGKVTAHGETQNCQVVLHNVFRSEIASMTTDSNGKYSFKNIPDGLYFITATTESDGMGYAVVVVHDGKVYGETDITVYKTDKVKNREDKFRNDIPECASREDALKHRDRIAEEKRFYDGLSEKEKKQLSKDYVNRLDQLVQWITDCTVETGDGVTMEQGGLVISGDEAANAENITFSLQVTSSEAYNASTDGVHNREDQIHHNIHDKSGKHDVLQYYDITLSKEVDGVSTQITSVTKDTEANGKLRVTMDIPEEYRGYKHYTIIHEHCGDVVTLTDLDNDPNTVTFEVNKFSTFVLAGTNITLTEIVDEESTIVESWGLTLADDIRVNFTMTLSEEVLADSSAYVEVEVADAVINVPVAEAANGIQVKLAAAQMNDGITLCIVDGSGNRSESSSYTVRQYCDIILSDADYSQYHKLVKQMLAYGGAAQSYFNYNADNRADTGITEIVADEIPESAEEPVINDMLSGVNYYGASLLFRDNIAVRFYFTGDVTGCSFQVNGETSDISSMGELYYVEMDGILPQTLDQQIALTVTDADGNTLTVAYGPMDYIARMNQKGSDSLKALLKALYNYHCAAKAFAAQ